MRTIGTVSGVTIGFSAGFFAAQMESGNRHSALTQNIKTARLFNLLDAGTLLGPAVFMCFFWHPFRDTSGPINPLLILILMILLV